MDQTRGGSIALVDHGQFPDPREQQIAVLGSWRQLGHVVYALAELRIADLLGDGPRSVEDLAAESGANAGALRRVLRCAAAVGIFAEQPDGWFTLTPLAQGLCADQVGGLRPMVLFSAMDFTTKAYGSIMHSLRTGEPAFDHVFDLPFHQYVRTNPDIAQFYERFLGHWSRRLADRFVPQLGLDRFTRVADLGGGTGYLLARVLQDQPHATGVLFDAPGVLLDADALLTEHGVADRATVVGGDLLTDPLPDDCDLYVLKSVLHRWPDHQCEIILGRIRAAMGSRDASVIMIDQILPPANQWDHSKVLDIDMLVLHGGKERNLLEWQQLFAATGFELSNEPEARGWAVLEVRPVP